jgi:betaine-aldehyde dehydrogenase
MSAPTTPRNPPPRRSGTVNVSVYSSVHSRSTYGPVTCRAPVSRGIANHGNTLVLKPSDPTPASTDHDIPAMVAITGSVAAAKAVAQAASKRVTKVHLELGGNAPIVVFEDADIAGAAADIAVAGVFNAGQDCTAATRVIAHESLAVELADALAAEAATVLLSRDEQSDSEDLYIPPINNAAQLDTVARLVSRVADHARVLAGGTPADGAMSKYE